MIKNIFTFLSSIFKEPILQRLLVVSLLPNVLVLGFTISEINTNSNFLWRNLIGPYWFIEKIVLITLALVVVGDIGCNFVISIKEMLHFEGTNAEPSHPDNINAISKFKNNLSSQSSTSSTDSAKYFKKKDDEWAAHVARCDARKEAQRDLEEQEAISRTNSQQQQNIGSTLNDSNSNNIKANALRDITGRGA